MYKNASKEFRRRESEKNAPAFPDKKMPAWKENLVSMLEVCEVNLAEADLDVRAQDDSNLADLFAEVESLPNDQKPSDDYLDYVALRVS